MDSSKESDDDVIYDHASDEDSESESERSEHERKPPPAKKARRESVERGREEDKLPNLCDYMIDRNYRRKWKLQDGIRELVQNTLDGAFVYAHDKHGVTSPRQLKPIGDPLVRKKKPPKSIGLANGYEVVFILAVDGKYSEASSRYFNKWTEDKNAVACIRCAYGTDEEFDKKDVKDGYLEDSWLYAFEAENRAINFGIKKILTLGDTTKTYSREQAGKFGEGLKVGAVSILREDFDLEIQGSRERCKFQFRKSRMTKRFTLHAKIGKSMKRYTEHPDLVGAKIFRSSKRFCPWQNTMRSQKTDLGGVPEKFCQENFRVLALNRSEESLVGKKTKGELLLADRDKAKVFCKSIFVEKKIHLLFGYDLLDLDLPMERNYVAHEQLVERSGELLADLLFESELEEEPKKKIKDKIVEMLGSEHSRSFVEAEVLYDDDSEYDPDAKLAKEIAQYFETLHGKEAFPCEENQKEDVEERLPGRKPLVVSETFLHILRRGGYRNLKEENDLLYTKDNQSIKAIDESPFTVIVTKALLRIMNAGLDCITRENIVFLQQSKLPKTKSCCKEKDGLFYINDSLLKGKDVEDESYMIAYHLIQTHGNDDVLTTFIKQRNEAVELEFEVKASAVGQDAIAVSLSKALHDRPDLDVVVREFRVAECTAAEDRIQSVDIIFRQNCAEQRKFRVQGLKPGVEYIAEAIDSSLVVVSDVRSGERCRAHCRTHLIFQEPSAITVRCFKNNQAVLAFGSKNTEIGVQFRQDDSLSFNTRWQEAGGVWLELKEGALLQLVCRPNDETIPVKERIVSSIKKFDFSLPLGLDHPSAPTKAEMWNTEKGCTVKISYPEELPPQSTFIIHRMRKEKYDPIVERILGKSDSTYNLGFQFLKPTDLLAYLAIPVGDSIIQSSAKVWLVSNGVEIVTVEGPSIVENAEEGLCQGNENLSVDSVGNPFGSADVGGEDDDLDDDSAYYGGLADGTDNESETNDEDSEYCDLDEDELSRVFEYKDDDSEYSPDDDYDDPSVHFSDDTCRFEGRTFTTGNTYFSPADRKWYTIVRLFPQRKPPKAECEVDMYLRDTFVGESASSCFDYEYKVRCESLSTVSLDALTFFCDERPETGLVHQREKGKREFAYYVEDDCDSIESIESATEQLNGLELFAGIGGMSCGFTGANLPVRWLVEVNDQAAANLKQQHPEAVVFVEDVRVFLRNVKSKKRGYPKRGEVSFIHLSPPCQGFSKANRNGGRNDERNNNLTECSIDAVLEFQPPVVVMENVTAILHDGKSDILKEVIVKLLHEDYQVRVSILTASDFGDPQKRSRMFLFAAKKGYDLPRAPAPTHGDPPNPQPFVSVEDALSDLAEVPPARQSGVVCFRNGNLTYNHKVIPRRSSDEKSPLDPEQLAPTTISSSRLGHYSENRMLTIREYLRLHSFPDSMQLFGSPGPLMKSIGNAVPVKLATAVAESIKKSLIRCENDDDMHTY